MELVVFRTHRSLIAESYKEEHGMALITLPGGGKMGVPERLILVHYSGYVPPRGLEDPAEALPKKLPYRKLIAKYCQKFQMDWKLVAALIEVESDFNAKAVSPRGAQGLMQLMPATQKEMGVKHPFSPEDNLRGGIHYLRRLLDAFGGDLELTLAAYNAGEGRVRSQKKVPDIPETQAYVAKILALYPTL